jgi:uncharacterized membrane protein SpoIIM required for sporulation/uncharacterized RDD family membrane protein YckC
MTDFTQKVEVETPELVVLSYTVAGVGSRVYAGFMDMLICLGIILGISLASFMLNLRFGGPGLSASSAWTAAFLTLAAFAVFWGYYVLCEWLFDGQTFGKWRLGLRVVRDGGYSVGFAAAATRNVMRAIDMQPGFFYLFGIASVVMSKSGKRLGDMVAGTIVIQERLVESPLVKRAKRTETPVFATARLQEEDFRLVERWYSRRMDIDAERRAVLTKQIADRVRAAFPAGDESPDGAKLIRLFEAERQARDAGASSRNETGAARERYAIVSTNSPRWLAFASTVAEAQRNGIKSLGETKVRDFVSEYRALSSDLARLRTASRDAAVEEMFYLSRLVGAAHNLLYKDRRGDLNSAVRFLFSDVPREVRRSAAPIALAAVLLFLPATIAGVAVVRHPEVAPVFIPPGMLDRAESGIKRAKDGSGYIEDPQVFRPVLASRIIANNVQVTFVAFAFGVTAGIGTALALLLNGVSIGGVLGLYHSKGILSLIVAFVAPHGVLELSAICIAGGGGFLIAAGILLPGKRTRRRALAENGRRAILLICASTLILIVAGAIEGLISPIPYWPLQLKLIVSGLTAVLMYLYRRGGSARHRPAADPRHAPAELLGLGAQLSGTGDGVTAGRAP